MERASPRARDAAAARQSKPAEEQEEQEEQESQPRLPASSTCRSRATDQRWPLVPLLLLMSPLCLCLLLCLCLCLHLSRLCSLTPLLHKGREEAEAEAEEGA